jgi:hypothetical protein
MKVDSITCPKCGYEFEPSEILTGQIEEQLKSEFDKKLQEQLSNSSERIKKQVTEESQLQLTDLQAQLKERNDKLEEANKNELAWRKKQRELEDKTRELELTVAKKLAEETDKIRQQAMQQYAEEHQLKDQEKDKRIQDLNKLLDEARRKATQGSMERQGEVFEDNLENTLIKVFNEDTIEPVPKGVRGADVIQSVYNKHKQKCGVILWEAKQTKTWSDKWIQKLKDDMMQIGAEIGVLISETLPKDIDNFDFQDGIWITSPRSALALATALREQLKSIFFIKQSSVGKNEKMEALYEYLAGPEFSQKITAIVESFASLQGQIDRERRAMESIWKEREKQLKRVINSTARMYGEMRGIIGATLPEIKSLELEAPRSEKEKMLHEKND